MKCDIFSSWVYFAKSFQFIPKNILQMTTKLSTLSVTNTMFFYVLQSTNWINKFISPFRVKKGFILKYFTNIQASTWCNL